MASYQRITIYSNGNQESCRLTHLLARLGLEFREYRLHSDFSAQQFRAEFGESAEYPQATLGPEHVGSFKQILQYFKRNNVF